MAKNLKMANKGKMLEMEVEKANKWYAENDIALIQKIPTPWVVRRKGAQIVSAFPSGKSTLDFRGTVLGRSISFDCKESEDARGLPLAHIQPHQIDYMRKALIVAEKTFILCHVKPLDAYYIAKGHEVVAAWDEWQKNKGKRGFNLVKIETMREVEKVDGVIDYLQGIEGVSEIIEATEVRSGV